MTYGEGSRINELAGERGVSSACIGHIKPILKSSISREDYVQKLLESIPVEQDLDDEAEASTENAAKLRKGGGERQREGDHKSRDPCDQLIRATSVIQESTIRFMDIFYSFA